MKCLKCGFEREEIFAFCPNCGHQVGENPASGGSYFVESVAVDPVADTVLKGLKSPSFLAACILVTVGVILNIANQSIPLLEILFAVFMWLSYARARKNIADANQLRNISGTVYANYVISLIASIFVAVAGLMMFFASSFAAVGLEEYLDNFDFGFKIPAIIMEMGVSFLLLLVGIGMLLGAALGIIFAVCGLKKIHTFMKSVYTSVGLCRFEFKKVSAAKNWLIFFGITAFISGVFSIVNAAPLAGLGGFCFGVAQILGSIIIKNCSFEQKF